MSSAVSICNQALAQLGAASIISLDDEKTEASLCKAMYAPLRDAVLEAYDWSFAIRWFDLPKLTNPPIGEYANAFQLPSSILRVIFVGQDSHSAVRDWQVEGDSIVTNAGNCRCKAIVRITDPSKFTPLFTQALTARLAAELAVPLTKSRSTMETLFSLYDAKLREAARRNNQQGTSRRIRSRWLHRARSGIIG